MALRHKLRDDILEIAVRYLSFTVGFSVLSCERTFVCETGSTVVALRGKKGGDGSTFPVSNGISVVSREFVPKVSEEGSLTLFC